MSAFTVVRRIVPLQFMAAPWLNGFQMILSALHALSWTLAIIATQRLFDGITQAAAGEIGFRQAVTPLLWMAVVVFAQQILNGLYAFMIVVKNSKTSGRIRMHLFQKLQRMDPVRFEDTDFLDDLNKARESVDIIPYFSMTFTDLALFYVVYFISVGAYLFWLSPMLVVTLALSFIPALIAQLVRVRVFTKLEQENAPLRRQYEYYQRTLCDREYFKETRILGAFSFFHKLYDDTMMLLTDKEWHAERKTTLLQLLLNIGSFAGMAIATLLLFNAAMAGVITVGAFAAVFGALSMIFSVMDEIVNENLGQRSKDIGKVANFIRMLDMPERMGTEESVDFSKGIVAESISLTYPGRKEPAISDLALVIEKGETVAIVGENGAGKSTLVRLLTGIYRPDDGTVTIGGVSSQNLTSAYPKISGVFQKYQRYKMTIRENVTISDRVNANRKKEIGVDQDRRISQVLKEADVRLEYDLDTMLSPEFDGIDLSGGEWQRLAIARGLYRTNDFVILDEPTAAIDPIEESRVYQQFQKLATGKCAVIVTHRLGSVKLADRVIVMDAGQIVDTGTHEELLSRPGKYADMWAAQAKWYER